MVTDYAWDKQNDAHKVWQAWFEICKRVRERLEGVNSELDDFDHHARVNEGRVGHPPEVSRGAEEVLLDKAVIEAALAIAEKRALEAKAEFESWKASIAKS